MRRNHFEEALARHRLFEEVPARLPSAAAQPRPRPCVVRPAMPSPHAEARVSLPPPRRPLAGSDQADGAPWRAVGPAGQWRVWSSTSCTQPAGRAKHAEAKHREKSRSCKGSASQACGESSLCTSSGGGSGEAHWESGPIQDEFYSESTGQLSQRPLCLLLPSAESCCRQKTAGTRYFPQSRKTSYISFFTLSFHT